MTTAKQKTASPKPKTKKAYTICMAQSKGGTAKTTSVVNLAAALAASGRRVLAVDLDQQANLTISLGVNPTQLTRSMRYLLTNNDAQAEEIRVQTNEAGVELLPSSVDLAMVQFAMPPMGMERILARKLTALAGEYDFILVDTPPSFEITTLNGLSASDYVLVPVQPEPLCLVGLAQNQQIIEQVRLNTKPDLELLGLFITMYDGRKSIQREIAEKLRQDWGDKLFKTAIRDRTNLVDNSIEGLSMVTSNPRSDVAKDYTALAQEIINRVN